MFPSNLDTSPSTSKNQAVVSSCAWVSLRARKWNLSWALIHCRNLWPTLASRYLSKRGITMLLKPSSILLGVLMKSKNTFAFNYSSQHPDRLVKLCLCAKSCDAPNLSSKWLKGQTCHHDVPEWDHLQERTNLNSCRSTSQREWRQPTKYNNRRTDSVWNQN